MPRRESNLLGCLLRLLGVFQEPFGGSLARDLVVIAHRLHVCRLLALGPLRVGPLMGIDMIHRTNHKIILRGGIVSLEAKGLGVRPGAMMPLRRALGSDIQSIHKRIDHHARLAVLESPCILHLVQILSRGCGDALLYTSRLP